ncbi:DsbE family thiol:disulfide interchange protein [Tsuneonella mangrovi]|uniref:DsbE family thiol:disulfide interchange protein n=1 Tax=Tsuneonella mangrovi TaxID=1982042 RepID=UPI000BA1F291|nr:DsbE family thiol:disulfide interchange protein [Tsuneonella mangrovi]
MKQWRYFLPLAVFLAFVGVAAWQLTQPQDNDVHSTMIGKPVPPFSLPPATKDRPGLSLADLKDGKPKLLNFWASWCVPCAAEAAQLAKLKAMGVTIDSIAIRDKPDQVAAFLAQYGNPYTRIGSDDLSKVQLSIGSSGVPETFVIDGNGVIRYQLIGDVRPETIPLLLEKLEEAGA